WRILLQEDWTSHPPRKPQQVLEPAGEPPMRQVLSIRLFWRPLPGIPADVPAGSNAAIDWYLLGVGSRAGKDALHYAGVGHVTYQRSGDRIAVTIRQATLQPVEQRGSMHDAFGTLR